MPSNGVESYSEHCAALKSPESTGQSCKTFIISTSNQPFLLLKLSCIMQHNLVKHINKILNIVKKKTCYNHIM